MPAVDISRVNEKYEWSAYLFPGGTLVEKGDYNVFKIGQGKPGQGHPANMTWGDTSIRTDDGLAQGSAFNVESVGVEIILNRNKPLAPDLGLLDIVDTISNQVVLFFRQGNNQIPLGTVAMLPAGYGIDKNLAWTNLAAADVSVFGAMNGWNAAIARIRRRVAIELIGRQDDGWFFRVEEQFAPPEGIDLTLKLGLYGVYGEQIASLSK